MLVAFEGKVLQVRQLTPTGFCEASLECDPFTPPRKVTGVDLFIMRKNDTVIIIGKEEIKPRFGPQTKILRWWPKAKCPFEDIGKIKDSINYLYDEIGLPPATAQKIFDVYLHEVRSVITDNPYRLVTEGRIKRLGVATVDKYIAPKLGIEPTDRRRLRAQILDTIKLNRSLYGVPVYVQEETGQQFGNPGGGHVYIDFSQLVGTCAEQMDLDRKTVANAVRGLAAEPRNPIDNRTALILEKDKEGNDRYVYLHALHTAENGLAHHVRRILNGAPDDLSYLPVSSPDLHLSQEQESAIVKALASPISIITGGPGTGKTTIIKALTTTLQEAYVPFALCAPTGVAARRMVKATGQPASTIHRLLTVNPVTGKFSHNRHNTLGVQFIICDESSMIDIGIMYSLFDAIPNHAKVVLVGDADQLPPVGPGAPFRDLVRWGQIPTSTLTEVRRQELADSLIIKGSRNILGKKAPEFSHNPPAGDLYAFNYKKETQALSIIVDLVTTKITKTFNIPREGIQVLCPHRRMRKKVDKETGEESVGKILASEYVNTVLQEKIHGCKPPEGEKFLVGDRVIHTKNNYNLNVMNGEIGYVKEVRLKEHKGIKRVGYLVEFEDNKRIAYEETDAHQLELAYALSVHKSQGSEFPATVILAYDTGNKFYSRNMLYTAVTRGKRLVCILTPVGGKSLSKILKADETARVSRLLWRIENGAQIDDENYADLDDLSDGDE